MPSAKAEPASKGAYANELKYMRDYVMMPGRTLMLTLAAPGSSSYELALASTRRRLCVDNAHLVEISYAEPIERCSRKHACCSAAHTSKAEPDLCSPRVEPAAYYR